MQEAAVVARQAIDTATRTRGAGSSLLGSIQAELDATGLDPFDEALA